MFITLYQSNTIQIMAMSMETYSVMREQNKIRGLNKTKDQTDYIYMTRTVFGRLTVCKISK